MKIRKGCLALFACGSLLAAALLLFTVVGAALCWKAAHRAPASKTPVCESLPLTSARSCPALQAKLRDLRARKLLPDGTSDKSADFELKALGFLLRRADIESLVELMDAFDDGRTDEPRYADWPDVESPPESIEDFLLFIRFHSGSGGGIERFKGSGPFSEIEAFIDASLRRGQRRLDFDEEDDPYTLFELCRLRFYASLAWGARTDAIEALDALFKFARSPLAPGLDGERCRLEASACVLSMLRAAHGLTERDSKELRKILERETAIPFNGAGIIDEERRSSLLYYESLRRDKESDGPPRILPDLWYKFGDAVGALFFAARPSEIDLEELAELELYDSLERKQVLAPDAVGAFLAGRRLDEERRSFVEDYANLRSRSDEALTQALKMIRRSAR